jgi:hypothetical protein
MSSRSWRKILPLQGSQNYSCFISRVMFNVQCSQRNCVGSFHYFTPWQDHPNGISSDPEIDHMKKLHQSEFDVPTYHFGVDKTIGFSSYKVMFIVHYSLRNGIEPIYYFSPWWALSNILPSDPNGDHMQKLCHREYDVPTYHIWVNKIIGVSSSRVMFRVHHIKIHCVIPFLYCNTQWDLSRCLLSDPNEDCKKKLCTR